MGLGGPYLVLRRYQNCNMPLNCSWKLQRFKIQCLNLQRRNWRNSTANFLLCLWLTLVQSPEYQERSEHKDRIIPEHSRYGPFPLCQSAAPDKRAWSRVTLRIKETSQTSVKQHGGQESNCLLDRENLTVFSVR